MPTTFGTTTLATTTLGTATLEGGTSFGSGFGCARTIRADKTIPSVQISRIAVSRPSPDIPSIAHLDLRAELRSARSSRLARPGPRAQRSLAPARSWRPAGDLQLMDPSRAKSRAGTSIALFSREHTR